MNNANMNLGARIPRNALRIWQSNETIATLYEPALTQSLRDAVCDHLLKTESEAVCNAVHPIDWPERCGYEALRETAYDLSRREPRRFTTKGIPWR
jgi:hypothetical protein